MLTLIDIFKKAADDVERDRFLTWIAKNFCELICMKIRQMDNDCAPECLQWRKKSGGTNNES